MSNASFFLESMYYVCHWHGYDSCVIFVAYIFHLVLMEIDNLTISGNILIRDLRTKTSNLTLQISNLNDSLTNLSTICNVSGLCDFLSSTEFAVNVNYTDVSLQIYYLSVWYICAYTDREYRVQRPHWFKWDWREDKKCHRHFSRPLRLHWHWSRRLSWGNIVSVLIIRDSPIYPSVELNDKAESEFQRIHNTIQNDYLNNINGTISDVSWNYAF